MFPDIKTFPITPNDIRKALTRHYLVGLACFGVVLFLAFCCALVMPRSYFSEAKIFVRFGRENLAVDPSATTGQVLSIYETRENEINSLLEVMRSRALLDAVTERIGADNILSGHVPSEPPAESSEDALAAWQNLTTSAPATGSTLPVSVMTTLQKPGELHPPSETHMRAVQWLEKNVFIDAPRRSSVIVIGSKASSPALAQRVVAELTELYLHEHTHVHSKSDSYEFFQAECDKLQRSWDDASQALQKAKDLFGVVTIDGKRHALETHLQDLQQRQTATSAALAETDARISSLHRQLEQLPDRKVATLAEVPSAAADQMRSTYFQVQLQAMELASRMDDSHPLLQAARQRVKDGAQALASVENHHEQTTTETHPARKAFEVSILEEQARKESLLALQTSLQKMLSQARTELQAWGKHEIEIARLQRDAELTEGHYRNAAEKLEQARISRQLDEQQLTNLRLVQPATFSDKPLGTGRKAVALLGLFVATIGGVGAPLILSWLRPEFQLPQDFSLGLNLPFIATIRNPLRPTDSERHPESYSTKA